ncbi:hypothetical protein C8A00DRAFT_32169 [Chaetomidium leptoderma]|uniref:Uncharacterized protein n=1 Tax=Chaetomidium leptoderma TaxID=669021 RepID=A0AAN6VPM9_9PEZI|nr:hypothetical protein C8A00DRAFT_32169 [Chaetomidium leptoderma]
MSGQGAAPLPQASKTPTQSTPTSKSTQPGAQFHWLQWSSLADTDRTYVVVFDKSTEAITTQIKRIAGPNTKPSTVPRVRGLFEDVEKGRDLDTVQAALVSAAAYATIKEKFDFKRINVKMGDGERTAFIPVARAASQGTALQAAPTAGKQANGGSNDGGSNAGGKGKAQEQA